jgi:cytochrome c oxidase subunit 2
VNTPLDQHMLVAQGPQAAHIADLWWFYLAIMAVVCVLIWTCILIALMRRDVLTRDPALDEDTLAETAQRGRPVRALSAKSERRLHRIVALAGAATVLTLFVLLVKTLATTRALASLPRSNAVHIELTGHRWWWGARYSEPDVSLSFTTANELHIPVGRPVELKLRSADVIHSFWVPNLHGKRDLVPGRDTTLWLRADRPGRYRGQCAEFCGSAHAQMALWIVAEPSSKFEAWKQAQRADAHKPSSAEAKRGQSVFMSGPCAMCHTISGTTAQSSLGPDLSHVASRDSLAAASLPNTRGHLAGWLLNAQNLKPGVAMPNISLAGDDLHALLAYLEELR